MNEQLIFDFNTDLSKIFIPEELNNPFSHPIPDIARLAATQFQDYISTKSQNWKYDFKVRNGKMFGVLVIQRNDGSYGFIGTASGVIDRDVVEPHFIPPVFDSSTDDFFINKVMTELTEIGTLIKLTHDPVEITEMKELRKQKSLSLQHRLFEHTRFLNVLGKTKNVLQIFKESSHGNPPSAAGECAAPKLLQYALKNNLRLIAIAEFWWGNSLKSKEHEHLKFYPACKNKCRPILEYMLNNELLYIQSKKHENSI